MSVKQNIPLSQICRGSLNQMLTFSLKVIVSCEIKKSSYLTNTMTTSDRNGDDHIIIQTARELKYDGITHNLERASGDFKRRIYLPEDAGDRNDMIEISSS